MGLASAAEEGMPETTPVTPLFDSAALSLLYARYLGKDANGRVVETPKDMFRRVAGHIAAVEERFGGDSRQWADRFEHAMSALEFLPNSPTLMNAGTPVGQLAACFVLPVEDHLQSIFATMRDAALVQRSGGGVWASWTYTIRTSRPSFPRSAIRPDCARLTSASPAMTPS